MAFPPGVALSTPESVSLAIGAERLPNVATMTSRTLDATPPAYVACYVLQSTEPPCDARQDGPLTVQSEVTKYLEELSVRTPSRHTRDAYRRDIADLVAFLKARGVDEPAGITGEALTAWLADQRTRGMSEATVARRSAAMRGFVDWLRDQGHVGRDVRGPKVRTPRARLPRALSREQVAAILSTCGARKLVDLRDRAVLEFLWSTGCRAAELCALDLDMLRLRPGPDGILRGEATVLGKGDRERVVYLTPRAADAVRRYVDKVRRPLEIPFHARAVFLSMPGQRLEPRTLWQIVSRRAKDAGIDQAVSPHTIRHTFATELIRGGASTEHVRVLLGHSSINTTQSYLHLVGGDAESAHRRLHPDAAAAP